MTVIKQTPQEIYQFALKERESDDPLEKRDAYEKGWLAVVIAIDDFLATKGYFIPRGDPGAHKERNDALGEVAMEDSEIWRLQEKFHAVRDSLHGDGFYYGSESPALDRALKETVSEILELTGALDS